MMYVCSEPAPDGQRMATYRCTDCLIEMVRLIKTDYAGPAPTQSEAVKLLDAR